jgi:hypothetical protein
MSQELNRVTRDNATASLRSQPWSGIHVLKLIRELNDRCLAELAQLAQSDQSPRASEFFGRHRGDWRSLDAYARREAARFPFLLLDIHFQDEEWWRSAAAPPSEGITSNPLPSFFPPKPAGQLIRETLVLAWHTVLSNRGAAMVLLGMSPAVCGRVAELGLQNIEHITARDSAHIHPRWEHLPSFWGQLLTAARGGDSEFLYDLHLHGFQLFGGALMPRRANT